MTPQRNIKQVQLPLPFRPGVTDNLTDRERNQLRLLLAQFLLSAAGLRLEEATDEQ